MESLKHQEFFTAAFFRKKLDFHLILKVYTQTIFFKMVNFNRNKELFKPIEAHSQRSYMNGKTKSSRNYGVVSLEKKSYFHR